MFDPIEDAAYRVVHDYPGGAVKLASQLAMNAGTLSNKVNPGCEGHHLSVREALAIQHATRDFRIIQAEAQLLDGIFLHFGHIPRVSDTELLTAYARWHEDIGETAKAIAEALADGKISRTEINRVRKEFQDDIARGFEFLERLEAVCDEH